jgi:hypothetical protein
VMCEVMHKAEKSVKCILTKLHSYSGINL